MACAFALAASAGIVSNAGADENGRTDVYVDCHTADQIGSDLCANLKDKVRSSEGYTLAANTDNYGIGVHLSSVDLFSDIEGKLSGDMSAVAVVFTIYANKLPGEMYLDSSVLRVGKGAIDDMSSQMLSAIGQQVNANTDLFNKMRTAEPSPSPKELAPATP
jgi:hypothetical protein